jgi:hypothetical protein
MPNKHIRTRLQLMGVALVYAFGTAIAQAQAPAKPKLPTGDPCTILPLGAVQKAFPGAQAGVRRLDIEKYGLTQCSWSRSKGEVLFGTQEGYTTEATVMDDAQGEAFGYLDPSMPAAKRGARFEPITGLGVDAIAFIETKDPKRGIVTDGAFLVLRKGLHTVTLVIPPPLGTDRAATLKLLEQLGRVAAKRLD